MSEGRRKRAAAAGASPATEDRRRHKRFIEEVRIRYRDLEGIEPAAWGHSRDLSLGGMCLLASESVPLGAHLAMEIHIETEPAPLLALGRVVRIVEEPEGDCAAGVEFLWVSDEDRANLARLAQFFRTKYGETGA